MYLYETHCHTNEASACAVNSGPEMARAYKAGGYAGIMVTNHFWRGNNCILCGIPRRKGRGRQNRPFGVFRP